ncbi:MAG: hypothetical protein U1A81_09765 [Hydrogenophaga sp.]|nr:hypothetical protein [Hydrogenophaga sp.]
MRITRPSSTRRQLWLANSLKAELLRLIKRRMSAAKRQDEDVEEWHELYSELNAVSEGFKVSFKTEPYAQVDRRCSMLAGPFFITPEFPAPAGASGLVMYPVVQFELSVLSTALEDTIGTGLLQLWFDIPSGQPLIRVIPQQVVESQAPVDFLVHPIDPDDAFPLPEWQEKDPVKNGVKTIRGLTSCGCQSTCDLSDTDCLVRSNEQDEWLRTLLAAFADATEASPEATGHMVAGGTLRAIQYNHSDVQMRPLLQFADWGSSGSAEIFFRTHKNKPTEFSFWACVN